jgi:(E)-4-hydroxy-3-methylbut-2-enyl-diphosphate synthase
MSEFRKPYAVIVGGSRGIKRVGIGGDYPVSIQTMWKASLIGADLNSIARDLSSLSTLGCDIVRFAVPDPQSADLLCKLASMTEIPLVADIHFDHTLALACILGGVSKVRINPGNIGSKERILAVVDAAKDMGTPIRIGVNSGSLPRDLQELVTASIERGEDPARARANALVETATREIALLDECGFKDVIVSMKASTVRETILSNEAFARRYDVPLHVGVTEAGPLIAGVVKSSIALNRLLLEGIGSTVRVSLSDSPESEVITAREILSESGARAGGVRIVSCPRCGRNGFDVHSFVSRWQTRLLSLDKSLTVAVMGCVVNGPGEGKHADIGITGAGDSVIIFARGQIVRKVDASSGFEAVDAAFQEELDKL